MWLDELRIRNNGGPRFAFRTSGERLNFELRFSKDKLLSISSELDRLKIEKDHSHKDTDYGIVICAGGEKYLTNAYVLLNLLRKVFLCSLPVQIWYCGKREIIPAFFENLERLGGVEFVDAVDRHGMRRVPIDGLRCIDGNVYRGSMGDGFALKSLTLVKTRFRNVIYLDSDCFPYYPPQLWFDCLEWRSMGAVFWRDWQRELPKLVAEYLCCVNTTEIFSELESGQIIIDTVKHFAPLQLANRLNELRAAIYEILYGDKDTFQVAMRRLRYSFALVSTEPTLLKHKGETLAYLQYDFMGNRAFQHRVRNGKFSLYGSNPELDSFPYHKECLQAIEHLRKVV